MPSRPGSVTVCGCTERRWRRGCAARPDLSARLGWLDGAAVERIESLVRRAGLPVRAPAALSAPEMRDLMAVNKKARGGALLRLVLLEDMGKAIVTRGYDAAALDLTLAECRAER